MNRLLASLGIVLTLLYVILVCNNVSMSEVRSLTPNNLGDFLAGVVGPIAILWLILGFFQQGIELRQNSAALHLQAEELRNSVEQQRQLVELTRQQVSAELESMRTETLRRVEAAKPNFVFHGVGITHSSNPTYSSMVRNIGNTAAPVQLTVDAPDVKISPTTIQSWARQENLELSWSFHDPRAKEFRLVFEYVDADGVSGHQSFAVVPVQVDQQNGSATKVDVRLISNTGQGTTAVLPGKHDDPGRRCTLPWAIT